MSKLCKRCQKTKPEQDFKTEKREWKMCNDCRGKRRLNTLEDCHILAKARGGKCLSEKYENAKNKLMWECSEGHVWKACYNGIEQGGWCRECHLNSTRKTIEDCHTLAKARGGKCLSEKYENAKNKLMWECSEGHKWESSYDTTTRSWCAECSGTRKKTIEDCRKFAESKGGQCLSEEYTNNGSKLEWKCKNGHIWKAKFAGRTWCKECYGNVKKDINECEELAQKFGGKCLSAEYIDNRTKLEWQCAEGHTWKAKRASLQQGHWCPYCPNKSEQICREIMEEVMEMKFPKARPVWLKGLELDGYNEEKKLAFEYNGKQHYAFLKFFHESEEDFENQQKRDRAKIRRCKRNGVDLVIIPYHFNHQKPEELRTYIEDELINLGRLK